MTDKISITITTPNGAEVTLTHDWLISAAINGKPHTSSGVELSHDREIGNHLELAGKAKAQVRDEDMDALRAFFAAARRRDEEAKAAYQETAEDRSFSLADRMYGRHSDY